MDMIRIFIGYDEREAVAYHTLSHSILTLSSIPVSITPLVRNQLPVNPERDAKASTDFADTRFLVPWLCDYKGWAIFVDCDELFTQDPKKLWDYKDDKYSVMVRKHKYQPEEGRKFLNQPQYRYEMKNWTSMMLFNCEKCKILTPEYVKETHGLALHQFKWTSMDQIGNIPPGWNHLVGEMAWDEKDPPMLIHYTTGGPYFNEYRRCQFSKEWFDMYKQMTYAQQTYELES